ncbi:uncharacterized protein A4U43_C07F19270 [Asparagus officinalis]|uniref:Mediator complex subunit 15 KIX domain-containing protein n=1 Tax=Asparagus officinalis TaxID=4686 RepID=A0A5P1EG64_ASPOF|nr:uncharacterized protein A4U43_C07F19270 [Asparagus officinalis]
MGEAISVLPNWRDGIPQGGRQRIVNKIMELLQTHERTYVPSDHLDVLREVATKYEDRAYTTASSVSDYLEVISLKVLTIRARQEQAQPSAPVNPAISNIAAVNQNRSHAGIQYEPVTLSHPNQLNQRRHILANRSVVDCKRNLILIDDSSTKAIPNLELGLSLPPQSKDGLLI